TGSRDCILCGRMVDLCGKVAAVTGGAHGIGRATAAAFLDRGMWGAIGDADEHEARRAATEIGAGAFGVGLDVSDAGSFEAFVDAAEGELGLLDVLVNNATVRQADAVACVRSVMFGISAVLPRMRARGRGHLVNVAAPTDGVCVAA